MFSRCCNLKKHQHGEPIHDSSSKESLNFEYLRGPSFEIPCDMVQPFSFTIKDDIMLRMENSIATLNQPGLPSPRVDLNQHIHPCFSEFIASFEQEEGGLIAGLEQQSVPSPKGI